MDHLVSGPRQLRRVLVLFQLIQSNDPDPYLDQGLAKIVDLQLLSIQSFTGNRWAKHQETFLKTSGNTEKNPNIP